MTDVIERGRILFRGFTRPFSPNRALNLLSHIDGFDPPEAYSERVSNVDSSTVDDVRRAQILWGDHIPTHADPTNPEAVPAFFSATYDAFGEDRIMVGVMAETADLAPFDDALAHVFDATALEPDPLDIILQPTQQVDPDAIDIPTGFLLYASAGDPQQIRLSAIDIAFRTDGSAEAESIEEARNTMVEGLGDMIGEMTSEVGEGIARSGDDRSVAPEEPTLDDDPTTFSLVDLVQPAIDDISTQAARELGLEVEEQPAKRPAQYSFEPTAETPEAIVREFHRHRAGIDSDEELAALASAYGHGRGIYTFDDSDGAGSGPTIERSDDFDEVHRIEIRSVDEQLSADDVRVILNDEDLQDADHVATPRAILHPVLNVLIGDTVVGMAETGDVSLVEGVTHTDGGELPFAHLLARAGEAWRLLV